MVQRVTVLVDATAIPQDRGGVGRYVEGLVGGLAPHSAAGDLRLHVACRPRDAERLSLPGVEVHPGPERLARRPARLLWEQTSLARLARRLGAGVLHCPHYTMPIAGGLPTVVTVHDLTFFTDPALHGNLKGRFFRSAIRRAARHAAAIVTPSQATADELARLVRTRVPVVVAPHGVDPAEFHPPTEGEVEALRRRWELPAQWVAFLGTLEPRKNVPALLRGFAAEVAARPDAPALVLAGGQGWDSGVDAALQEAISAGAVVRRPGYVPLGDLPALLGGATVVCYPSLGEGFGLPVLESMACGAAVLTTRALSLPEVGGEAVAYCGTSAPEIGRGIAELLDDVDRRRSLGELARTRAATFTWSRSAEHHLHAYRSAT